MTPGKFSLSLVACLALHEQQQGTDHGIVLDWLLSHFEVTVALGRRVVPGKSGRPRKETERASADLVA